MRSCIYYRSAVSTCTSQPVAFFLIVILLLRPPNKTSSLVSFCFFSFCYILGLHRATGPAHWYSVPYFSGSGRVVGRSHYGQSQEGRRKFLCVGASERRGMAGCQHFKTVLEAGKKHEYLYSRRESYKAEEHCTRLIDFGLLE